ncbi:MAG: hypothetical protein CTY20_14485 [Hyphomicrobium sp.]|nr:MAG: hypothetical protein CTY20_14485 [Hyphomicrobium sp.]
MTAGDVKIGSGPTSQPLSKSREADRKGRRQARLEEELRANLKRRKDQVRLRDAVSRADAGTPIDEPDDHPAATSKLQD